MGDPSGRRRPRPPSSGEDRISCLPDELLLDILICLGSARAAAQTTVLSRRWQRVWTRLPELFLRRGEGPLPASTFLDAVDAALAASAAPTLKRLWISVPYYQGDGPGVPAHRVAPWLRFASQLVVGDIFLNLGRETTAEEKEAAALELPACDATTAITLRGSRKLRFGDGVFAALAELVIQFARVDGRELSDLVSTQCPRLRKLNLLVVLVAVSDVTIHSNSLHSLSFFAGKTGRLEIVAPKLEVLSLRCRKNVLHISAPNLSNVTWSGAAYDPRLHQFAQICRRLHLLNLRPIATITPLMEQFKEVDELRLHISIPRE